MAPVCPLALKLIIPRLFPFHLHKAQHSECKQQAFLEMLYLLLEWSLRHVLILIRIAFVIWMRIMTACLIAGKINMGWILMTQLVTTGPVVTLMGICLAIFRSTRPEAT